MEKALIRWPSGKQQTIDKPVAGSLADAVAIFELEKAVYELRYELNNRPDWVGIPVAGIARFETEDASPASIVKFAIGLLAFTVFVAVDLKHVGLIVATIAVGAVIGAVVSRRVAILPAIA